jgi:hypothetical protein
VEAFLLLLSKHAKMTTETFNSLPEIEKNSLLFAADKIDEVNDGFFSYRLFKLDNIFVEVKSAIDHSAKRRVSAYSLKEIPLCYTSQVYAMIGK